MVRMGDTEQKRTETVVLLKLYFLQRFKINWDRNGNWMNHRIEKHIDLYSSLNMIDLIISGRLGWSYYLARMDNKWQNSNRKEDEKVIHPQLVVVTASLAEWSACPIPSLSKFRKWINSATGPSQPPENRWVRTRLRSSESD